MIPSTSLKPLCFLAMVLLMAACGSGKEQRAPDPPPPAETAPGPAVEAPPEAPAEMVPETGMEAAPAAKGIVRRRPEAYTYEKHRILAADKWVSGVQFSPDDGYLAYRAFDTFFIRDRNFDMIWRFEGGRIFGTYFTRLAAFSPDEAHFVFVPLPRKDNIALLRMADLTLVASVKAHSGGVSTVAYDPQNGVLATGGEDALIKIWEPEQESLAEVQTLEGHTDWIHSLEFDTAGEYLASAGKDKSVRLWRRFDGRLLPSQVLEGHSAFVDDVAFSPDGQFLASASEDNTVHVWIYGESGYRPFQTLPHDDSVFSVDFSPDGRYLASAGGEGVIRLWKVSEDAFTLEHELAGHRQWIGAVAFSADGAYLASGGKDGTVRIWQKVPVPPEGPEPVALGGAGVASPPR